MTDEVVPVVAMTAPKSPGDLRSDQKGASFEALGDEPGTTNHVQRCISAYKKGSSGTMFAHILVPLDGSARAEEALPVAARIARASGGSIHLLEVVSHPIDYGAGYATDPLLSEQEIESETTTATDYLQTMVALPVLDGIQVTTELAPGFPAQYILATARSTEAFSFLGKVDHFTGICCVSLLTVFL